MNEPEDERKHHTDQQRACQRKINYRVFAAPSEVAGQPPERKVRAAAGRGKQHQGNANRRQHNRDAQQHFAQLAHRWILRVCKSLPSRRMRVDSGRQDGTAACMFINFLLFFFLVFKLIVGPIASVQLLYLIRAGKMRERPRRLNFAVGILWAAINIWWAREIANSLGITIFSWPARIVTALVLGAAVMSGGYLTTVLTKNLRWRSEVEDRFLRTMLPNALTDLPLWILLSVAVGISEELVFRGVLFNLLS